jgi:predicted transglutaminase-like cysteine proteinase
MIYCPPFMRRQRRNCAVSALVAGAMILLASVFAPAATAASNTPADSIFGTKELHSSNLNMFPKWRDALRRFDTELKTCTGTACKAQEWNGFIDSVRNVSREEQVRAVNREMNDKPYVTDPVNWHMPDYWATPLQFLRKDGDCEDYAISKYGTDEMRIVVLQDTNLNVPHAVLVVFLRGRALVLDNQVNGIVPADSIHHYHPYYSINEDGWWLHRG